MSASDCDTPFSENSADTVDEWSRCVFDASRDWPLARMSSWFRSDDGCLTLRIEKHGDEVLERLFVIELDTLDEQINLDFGSWCTPISRIGGPARSAARDAVTRARELIEGWLRGDVKLASYSDESGWRGSKIIDKGDLPAAIEPVPVSLGQAGRVIIKTARRADWRAWRQERDGAWVECELA